jgi:glycosyltransferase involved in cell wall biosynthesis
MGGEDVAGGREPLRVNFVCNTCNNHYVLAKGLRRLGVEAKLFFEEEAGFQDHPASEDPELADGPLPNWVIPVPRQWSRWTSRARLSREILERIADCDLLHVHGIGVVWAARTGRPFVWHPYGTDVTSWLHYHSDLLLTRRRDWPVPLPRPYNIRLPVQMRRAIACADRILLGWHNNLWRAGYQRILRGGLQDRIVRFHLAIDTKKFAPPAAMSRDALLARLLPGEPLVQRPLLFHPIRQAFSRPGDVNGYKANDRLYRALSAFAKKNGRFTLVVVEKGIADESVARALIEQLGISAHVRWIKSMPRHLLVPWYQAADVVVESFFTGAIGSVPLESMACGTPVMMHLRLDAEPGDKGFFLDPHALYPELPPIITCRTEEEILDRLVHVVADPLAIENLRRNSRAWIESHASIETKSARLLALYRTILDGSVQGTPGRSLSSRPRQSLGRQRTEVRWEN